MDETGEMTRGHVDARPCALVSGQASTARPLTPRQADTLRAIVSYAAEYGQPPTMRELGEVLGIRSTNRIDELLNVLVRRGFITRRVGRARGLRVLKEV